MKNVTAPSGFPAVFLVCLFMMMQGVQTAAEEPGTPMSLETAWGIRIEGVRRTASGFMIDFRYRVLDAQKAEPLFRAVNKPVLLDQKSGARFMVPSPPKVGTLRSTEKPKENTVYWIFFANPGGHVSSGDLVTITIGDFTAENLTVE